jgi:hypothetical protein
MKGGVLIAILAGTLLAGMGMFGLVQEWRRRDSTDENRRAYDLALGLGDYRSALKTARQAFGLQSREAREAEILDRESGLFEKERSARACLLAEDWENAAAWFRLLLAEVREPDRKRFTQALAHCESLARGRRFEREGSRDSALAVYQALLLQGSPYAPYLKERIESLERRAP